MKINIEVNSIGAELKSIYGSVCNNIYREFLHKSNAIWKSSAPLLFPTIGKSKDSTITVDGKNYSQCSHGFVRNSEFEYISSFETFSHYRLNSDERTKIFYPYDFSLDAMYKVKDNSLTAICEFENTDNKPIYYNFGFHPGFTLPAGLTLDDCMLVFDSPEENSSIIAGPDGLSIWDKSIYLYSYYFDEGKALVFKNLNSRKISLFEVNGSKILDFKFSSPFLGIWSRSDMDQPFICFEPWYGLPNKEYAGELRDRPNIMSLVPGEKRTFSYQVVFYR
ncbi:MAG: hypothetical protein N2749_01230 [Clostridia bacterium]|nr:hypothetical protein [Clostridia bacterium]